MRPLRKWLNSKFFLEDRFFHQKHWLKAKNRNSWAVYLLCNETVDGHNSIAIRTIAYYITNVLQSLDPFNPVNSVYYNVLD